jgi:hypothetical protein
LRSKHGAANARAPCTRLAQQRRKRSQRGAAAQAAAQGALRRLQRQRQRRGAAASAGFGVLRRCCVADACARAARRAPAICGVVLLFFVVRQVTRGVRVRGAQRRSTRAAALRSPCNRTRSRRRRCRCCCCNAAAFAAAAAPALCAVNGTRARLHRALRRSHAREKDGCVGKMAR